MMRFLREILEYERRSFTGAQEYVIVAELTKPSTVQGRIIDLWCVALDISGSDTCS